MPENLNFVIAENLRIALGKVGMTQADLASRVGISASKMSELARGNAPMSTVELFRISRVFGVSTEWFAEEHVSEIQI